MPRKAANRIAPIAAALQWDRGRWIWLLLILLLLGAVLGLGDSVSALLRYDRSAIAAGGWWRVLMAHHLPLHAHPLILNEFGSGLVGSFFPPELASVEWVSQRFSGASGS